MARATFATARIAQRPATLLVATVLVLAALGLAAWWWAVQSAVRTSSNAQQRPTAIVNADVPTQGWPMIAPEPVADASDHPTPAPQRSSEPNWQALALGIADTGVPATAVHAAATSAFPADLEVPLSTSERGRLIAASREPSQLPSPPGYIPGIVVVTSGTGSDGVCKCK